jgi:hypothetical protein
MSKGTLRIRGRNLDAVRTIGGGALTEVAQKAEELAAEVREIINGDAEVHEPTIEWCRNGILACVYIRCLGFNSAQTKWNNIAISQRFKGWRIS